MISGDLLVKQVEPRFLPTGSIKKNLYEDSPVEDVGQDLGDILQDRYEERRKEWLPDVAEKVERSIILHTIDQNWTKHIDAMARLREGIHLRSYANVNPLQDYVNEGYRMFKETLEIASVDAVLNLLNIKLELKQPEDKPADVVAEQKPAPAPEVSNTGESK